MVRVVYSSQWQFVRYDVHGMAHDDRYLGGNLSDDAYEGWHRFARERGITVVALLEAMGRQLSEFDESQRLPDMLDHAVVDARTIAAERRARRGSKLRG